MPACLFIVIGMIMPVVGLAALRTNRGNASSIPTASATKKAIGVCARTGELLSKIDQRLTDREAKIRERRTERAGNFKERRDNRDAKLEQFRDKWNENREQFYAKLGEKADTDAKKQALEKFKITVETAVKTRRAAIDQAIENYREAVDKLVADRKAAIDAVKSTYRSATRLAFQNANDECAKNDVDPAKVREQLRADLKAARDKYQTDIQAAEKVGKSIQDLIKARREAVAKAVADFKTVLEKARVDLKAAFGAGNASTTTPAE